MPLKILYRLQMYNPSFNVLLAIKLESQTAKQPSQDILYSCKIYVEGD